MYKPRGYDDHSNYHTLDTMMNLSVDSNVLEEKTDGYSQYNISETKMNDLNMDIQITSIEHRKVVIEGNEVVCLYLSGDYCQPCRAIFPTFVELARKYNMPGKCALVKERMESLFTKDYQATAVPCFIFYKNGKLVRNEKGDVIDVIGGDFNQITSILNKLLR